VRWQLDALPQGCQFREDNLVVTLIVSLHFSGGGGGGRGSSSAKLDERGMARAMAALSALWTRSAVATTAAGAAGSIDEARMQRCGCA